MDIHNHVFFLWSTSRLNPLNHTDPTSRIYPTQRYSYRKLQRTYLERSTERLLQRCHLEILAQLLLGCFATIICFVRSGACMVVFRSLGCRRA